MKLPPKQMACSVGHFLQSPGLSMEPRENEVFAGQSIHLINLINNYFTYYPESVNFSPDTQVLTSISS
jgi:hypothetical protein